MGVLDACPAKLHPIRLIEIRGHADLSTLANWVAGRQVRIHMNTLCAFDGEIIIKDQV